MTIAANHLADLLHVPLTVLGHVGPTQVGLLPDQLEAVLSYYQETNTPTQDVRAYLGAFSNVMRGSREKPEMTTMIEALADKRLAEAVRLATEAGVVLPDKMLKTIERAVGTKGVGITEPQREPAYTEQPPVRPVPLVVPPVSPATPAPPDDMGLRSTAVMPAAGPPPGYSETLGGLNCPYGYVTTQWTDAMGAMKTAYRCAPAPAITPRPPLSTPSLTTTPLGPTRPSAFPIIPTRGVGPWQLYGAARGNPHEHLRR